MEWKSVSIKYQRIRISFMVASADFMGYPIGLKRAFDNRADNAK